MSNASTPADSNLKPKSSSVWVEIFVVRGCTSRPCWQRPASKIKYHEKCGGLPILGREYAFARRQGSTGSERPISGTGSHEIIALNLPFAGSGNIRPTIMEPSRIARSAQMPSDKSVPSRLRFRRLFNSWTHAKGSDRNIHSLFHLSLCEGAIPLDLDLGALAVRGIECLDSN